MRIKKRPFHFLLLAILFAIGIGYLMVSYPPSFTFTYGHLSFPILPLFLLGILGFFFSLLTYLTYSRVQGILFGVTVITYLLLRLSGLTHVFFAFLLLSLFVTLELFFLKKK